MAHPPDPLDGRPLILLSNREPYEHVRVAGHVQVKQPAGGVVSALDPTMRRLRGTWVAWGSGSADRDTADAHGRVPVPPEAPEYTLRRVWLDEADVEGYYLGFANSALWPLCHLLVQHFTFRVDHWERYRRVNARFAQAVVEEARRADEPPVVWIQDYHFACVAGALRRAEPALFVHQFWHIPFPPPDILRLLPLPVAVQVLRGLLGNDLLEFQTERYAANFIACVADLLPDAETDREALTVRTDAHTTHVGAFPISVDFDHYEAMALDAENTRRAARLRRRHAPRGRVLGVSVDRIDYTKGIPERLRALEQLWTDHPDLRGRFTMLFVATPSRSELDAYKRLENDVVNTVLRLNHRFRQPGWTPIVLVHENVDSELLAGVYRAGDLCLVSSLQDGMNLVAKEYVACQVEERGVLLLSRFTGAAEEIDGAILINPFNIDGFVAAIRQALELPLIERHRRMHEMRAQLRRSTIFDWLDAILARCAALAREGAVRGR